LTAWKAAGDMPREWQGTRGPMRAFGFLVAASLTLFACSSDSTSTGSLGFAIADSILVLEPDDATKGYVVLSSGTGTCAALQSGLTLIPSQVGNLDYVLVLLGVDDASQPPRPLPLTAGSYTIVDPTDPNGGFTPPGLLANSSAAMADGACSGTEIVASSGTATLVSFNATDGGSSSLNYTAVFGGTQVTGAYTLVTCLVPSTTPGDDAGTCAVCAAPDGGTVADGGTCAIP
jgi:hypothetical protein